MTKITKATEALRHLQSGGQVSLQWGYEWCHLLGIPKLWFTEVYIEWDGKERVISKPKLQALLNRAENLGLLADYT